MAPSFTTTSFSKPPALVLGPDYCCPPALQQPVDALWAEQKQQRGERLTDGTLYHLAEIAPHQLILQSTRYRYYVARLERPHWVEEGLTIQPLAVTGLLSCADGIVLGQRGGQVITNPGYWELSPAGGLNQADPIAVLYEELHEELGLSPAMCDEPQLIGLLGNPDNGVHDLLYRLHTPLPGQAIRTHQQQQGSDEYGALRILAPTDLPRFLQQNRQQLVPELLPMLQLAKLLPGDFVL
ncbi:NUDIX hydrolase [Magnetococcus marinus MC-1]|uniref:NUDIX hydrolase n=1 Tax=Magnetococcus marinus (strain ATCC BAA-1437 / JCM 17883 / MC-1) TaxID=156889 RepID=A0LAB5_MAGMM|nr:NUDIX hydrolase [Magnetococcus marinus]ABK44908.1 NUDIX hydrolase [Magnetococcus marinus MC-1]